MTELYLNGRLAVLPDNIEFSIVEENPFLTKNGEFSFDIELSLEAPENSRIFGNINRFNAVKNVEEMPAILVVDSRVRLNGIATILSITDNKVHLQLLSGNSELNYFINSDMYIRELDLGEVPPATQLVEMMKTWQKEYNYGYCYPTVMVGSTTLNQYIYPYPSGILPTAVARICPMPYLWYYVQKIPQALGYTVAENVLDNDSVFRRLFVVHGVKSRKYARMLGGWKIVEFLSEIEKFCNISFIIDKNSKTVRILRNDEFTGEDGAIEFIPGEDVLDEYTVEPAADNNMESIDYDAVKYVFSDDNEGKYHDLAPEVFENTVEQNQQDMDMLLSDNPSPPASGSDDLKTLYRVHGTRIFDLLDIELDEYFIWAHNNPLAPNDAGLFLKRVHDFRTVGDTSKNTVELKICPAEFALGDFLKYDQVGFVSLYAFKEMMPAIGDPGSATDNAINDMTAEELIEDGIDDADTGSSSVIPVAYMVDASYVVSPNLPAEQVKKGLVSYDWNYIYPLVITDAISSGFNAAAYQFMLPHSLFPSSFTGTAPANVQSVVNSWDNAARQQVIANIQNFLKYTMRLHGARGFAETNYWKNVPVNSKEIWTVRFISKTSLDVRRLFVIRNKKFLCVSIEIKITADGVLPVVEGKFLPAD